MVCYKVLPMRLFSCKCAKSFETACKAKEVVASEWLHKMTLI